MSRWPNAFFMMAAFYILIGTCWGMYMSVTHDFATSPAHAHLNLLGFMSLSVMGAFYALLGRDTPGWLVKANFFLNNIGVICMITALTLLFTQKATIPQLTPLFMLGGPLIILGFACFFTAVAMSFRRRAGAAVAA
ncbi:MAG: cytochrome-c oxidase [Pseudomonadota bacterium]